MVKGVQTIQFHAHWMTLQLLLQQQIKEARMCNLSLSLCARVTSSGDSGNIQVIIIYVDNNLCVHCMSADEYISLQFMSTISFHLQTSVFVTFLSNVFNALLMVCFL